MCHICNRTSHTSLQAAIAVALIKSGVDADIVVKAASDVITEFAKSEVAHPEWAADILGAGDKESGETNAQNDETNAENGEESDDIKIMELAPGLRVHVHRVRVGAKQDESESIPPEVKEALRSFASMLVGGRKG